MRPRALGLALGLGLLALALALALFLREAPREGAIIDFEIGGPFSLARADGGRMSEADLVGRPHLVFFGFTHCPAICPTTLGDMTMMLDELGDEADEVTALFVTIDPERDTAERLADYLESFHSAIVGLTGAPEEIAAMAKAYRAYFKRVDLEDGDYTMDHTASVFLFDREGRFRSTIDFHDGREASLDKLRRAIGG